MKFFLFISIFPVLCSATLLSPYSTKGGLQIIGGNYHSGEDIFESGVRCLEVEEPYQIENVRDERATVSAITVMDFTSLRNEFGLGMSVGSDGWLTSGNEFRAAFDFLKKAEETDTSIVFIYKTELNAGDEILKTPFKLTPEAKSALAVSLGEFKKYCGDQFVYKISKGARGFVAIKIDLGTKSNKRKVEMEFKLGFVDLLSLSATLRKLKENLGISSTVTIAGFQEGGFAARINGIFGRGDGVANCNTTDFQNCEITIKEVLHYFSNDFSRQFDHFYTPPFGFEAAPLPNTAKIISYDTRSYCKLVSSDRENLACDEVDITGDLNELSDEMAAFNNTLDRINKIFSNGSIVLLPDYKQKLSMYRDSILKNLELIQSAKLSCKTDSWSCKSTVKKTSERLQRVEGNLTEDVKLENRIEFCFTTGLNSKSGKIELVLKTSDDKERIFSIEENPIMGMRSCYDFDFQGEDVEFTEVRMRAQPFASIDPKCEKKLHKKYLSLLNWELMKVETINLATGASKIFEGTFFHKKPKCERQENSKTFTEWVKLKPSEP